MTDPEKGRVGKFCENKKFRRWGNSHRCRKFVLLDIMVDAESPDKDLPLHCIFLIPNMSTGGRSTTVLLVEYVAADFSDGADGQQPVIFELNCHIFEDKLTAAGLQNLNKQNLHSYSCLTK